MFVKYASTKPSNALKLFIKSFNDDNDIHSYVFITMLVLYQFYVESKTKFLNSLNSIFFKISLQGLLRFNSLAFQNYSKKD